MCRLAGPPQEGMVLQMKQVVATALCLFLLLFLLPVLLIHGEPLVSTVTEPPTVTGMLPIDRTVVTPPPAAEELDNQVTVKVALPGGTVESMPLGKYLWSVVAAEMPASFEPEALKAQTVAARTYTVAKMGRTVQNHPDADVCTDITCCQAYIGREAALKNWGAQGEAYAAKIAGAVDDTDGMVILYQGAPIQAVFFSSAAGKTVDAVEVWGNDVPYLSSVESPEGDEVPGYHSTAEIPLADFKSKLQAAHADADLSGDPAGWFQNTVFNSAGGVETVELGGVTVRGSELRTIFGLRSTNFTISPGAQAITFSVTGYGHGVGMSQYGANALAREGKDYQEILGWYYTGVTIEPMTPD